MPMPVKISEVGLPGILQVETRCAHDARGFFSEMYSETMWRDAGFEAHFVQDNLSLSTQGTLRGMHYQLEPYAMGKLVRTVTGAVFDAAVDLRRGSPTFGRWYGQVLSAANQLALWFPPGFAHGFLALEEDTRVLYKCTRIHVPEAERSLLYNDPAVGIEWPFEPALIAPKDAAAPPIDQAEYNFEFTTNRDFPSA